jgi:outer membrane lipase/esterase
MRHVIAALLSAALGFAPAARAETFTSFWAFGDSLSDDGNLYAGTGGAAPPPPYFQGRFSNGPVWAEGIAGDFAAKGLATANYAYGGAAVGPLANPPFPSPPVENLGEQIDRFRAESAGRLGAKPVASLWFGANNLIFDGVPNGTAREVGRAAANGLAAGVRELRDGGIGHVLLFNLPALDQTPLYALGGDPAAAEQARIGTRAFNATLGRRIAGLERNGVDVIKIDAFALFNALLADPQRFGVVNATEPCYVPTIGFYCGDAVAPALAFFDPIHPSSTIHAEIAEEVRGQVAPVPLPAPLALMLAALGALGISRWLLGRGFQQIVGSAGSSPRL